MSKIKQMSQGGLLLFTAGLLLWGGCTFIPVELDGLGCDVVTLTPVPDRYGFAIQEEDLFFTGTIFKSDLDSQNWHLDGEFNFPTKGYSVLEPKVEVLPTWPQQVNITLSVRSPKLLSCVCSSDMKVPVSVKIKAATNAEFTMEICSLPESRCGWYE